MNRPRIDLEHVVFNAFIASYAMNGSEFILIESVYYLETDFS